jgi:molybdenum-dependent DNA-binding transcriptional regulator ModE
MIGKFNSLECLEQGSELIPNVEPDAFSVAPEFDSTEQLRVEIDDTDESRPVRYTSDIRLILHTKDLASRAGIAVASKFGQSKQSTSQIQQVMDKMSDDDLLATVRSRHIQSPSEIIAWSKELFAYAENLEAQAQELIDIETAKQEEEELAAAAAAAAASSSSSSE